MKPSLPSIDRRRFLRGSGGAALALPFLPSLFATDAAAQAAGSQKWFIHMLSWHGGVYQRNMYPAASTQTERMTYAGHGVQRGSLVPAVNRGETRVSEMLRAPAAALPAGLAAKNQDVAHHSDSLPAAQDTVAAASRRFFSGVVLDQALCGQQRVACGLRLKHK